MVSDWRYAGSDARSTRFSPLSQIDSTNVSKLKIIWRWSAPDWDVREREMVLPGPSLNECTPLMVDGVLYVSSPLNIIAALDPATGQELWRFDPQTWKAELNWSVIRGLAYWSDADEARILFGTTDAYLYSLDARTGKPDPDFGQEGRLDLTQDWSRPVERTSLGITSPPIICRGVVVVGGYADDEPERSPEFTGPGGVRGFDVRTGELLWTFNTVPQEGEFGSETWENESWKTGARNNVWSLMSADDELGYVYLPVGTPNNDYYGGKRPGDNLFASSLVCLEAKTGRRVWHYQIMHHPGWNLDLAHPPMLFDIEVDGRPIKAVVQTTKQSLCFVFDRVTGEPVWPIEEVPVPQSSVPGEKLSATQPIPTRPQAYDRLGLSDDDLIDFTPELKKEALELLSDYDYGPLYTPPSLRGSVVTSHLGNGWWSGAVNPDRGWLYVSSRSFPFRIQVRENTDPEALAPYSKSRHRPFIGPRGLPITRPPYGRITAIDLNTGEHKWRVPAGTGMIDHPEIRHLELEPVGSLARFHLMATKTLLFASSGDPVEQLKHSPVYYTDPEFNLWVYDLDNGRTIARIPLPSEASGNPMTYMAGGRQYIVAPIGREKRVPQFVAYAIPHEGEVLPPQRGSRTDAEHVAYYEAGGGDRLREGR